MLRAHGQERVGRQDANLEEQDFHAEALTSTQPIIPQMINIFIDNFETFGQMRLSLDLT